MIATTDIWKNYRLQLFNFIKRQVHDPHLAKDILQDVFIKADQRKHEIKKIDKIGGWMFAITRNAIADFYRKNNREKNLTAESLSEVNTEHDYNACVAHCLNQLVYSLPEPYQQALVKAEIEGLPQTQLASALGLSHSGAKSRVQRARKMLKEKLMELYSIETDPYGNIIVCEDKIPCKCSPDIFCS
jgi:RNA polymerase sigma-70 factor, ECF subfamily